MVLWASKELSNFMTKNGVKRKRCNFSKSKRDFVTLCLKINLSNALYIHVGQHLKKN